MDRDVARHDVRRGSRGDVRSAAGHDERGTATT
jgi:hypothetical protein